MIDLLGLLPKDVQSIVYRLLFDYNYTILKLEYKDRWLNRDGFFNNSRRDAIWWSDAINLFVCCRGSVANYRNYYCRFDNVIYNFYKIKDVGCKLPTNYW